MGSTHDQGHDAALEAEIATRKRFEEALRRSQNFLSSILGALPWRIAVLDERGTIIAVNTQWERSSRLEHPLPSVPGLGSSYLEVCERAARDGAENASALAQGVRAVLEGQEAQFSSEYAGTSSKGRPKWFQLRATAFEEEGAPRVVLSLSEITQRKAAEEALHQSLNRTRLILDAAVDGILTIDHRGRIETMNPAAERLFGFRADEAVGRNVNHLMPSPYREEHNDYLRRYLETGEARIIGIGREVHGQRRDGEIFPMDLAVSEFMMGDRRMFLGIVRDITERRRMEEEVRQERDFAESLVDTAQVIVLVLDHEGRIVRFNRFMEEVTGYLLEEVQGADWFETFVPERDRESLRDVFQQVMRGASVVGHINSILDREGQERTIEWSNKLLTDASDEIVGVLATGQDITERLRLEEQFRQAQKIEAVGRLAGGVAHDFNTLLGSILGYGEMLLDRLEEGSPLRHPVEQLLRGANRGADLTRQLLAFSRRQVLEPRILDLNQVLGGMEDMLGRLIGEDIDLGLDLAQDLGAVEVDAGQIEQVVMNLVVNAADAIPSGGRICLRTRGVTEDDASPEVILEVEDDGVGMAPETRQQIFEPFFTTKEPGKGTGLGLSTVYGIVTQSGGRLEVESELGKGTVFRVILPQVAATVPVASPSSDEADPPVLGNECVMVVEDDQLFRELLVEVLEERGFEVLSAENPAQALDLAESHAGAIDLLVSDMVMPGLSGSDLARHLLERYPSLRILLMSGYSQEALEDRGALSAGHAFLRKPFKPRQLATKVREVLDVETT